MKIFFCFTAILCLMFSACSSPSKNPDTPQASKQSASMTIEDTYWKLVELNGQPVNNPPLNQKEAYIQLSKADHRVQGSGGCNNLMGSYELTEGNRLRFSQVASTMMACNDMQLEDGLKKVLEMTDNFAISGNHLMLHKAKMAPLAKFQAIMH